MTTFLEAALLVLRSSSEPLSVNQITEQALRKGLISTRGKTPEATMSAALYDAIGQRHDMPIRRIFEQGPNRARRGTVRWLLTNGDKQPTHVKPARGLVDRS